MSQHATADNGRILGEFEFTEELAAEDENVTVYELPEDLVEDHLTKTYTPNRYARVCRDVAYFTNRIGDAPHRGMGKGAGSPGSGMRRSKEGALYKLSNRKGLLSRSVDLGFISIDNTDGFDAPEDEWRFSIQPRGAWFLSLYYGEHVPVRKVKKVKLSRWSSATNVVKIVVSGETAESAKSYEKWSQQVEDHNNRGGDVSTGYYRIRDDSLDTPEQDPRGEDIVTWIDESDVPTQFDVSSLDCDVRLACNVERMAEKFEESYNATYTNVSRDENGDLVITGPGSADPIDVVEDNGRKVGIAGEYEAFVESGAKDALKEATDAQWSSDHKRWYVPPEQLLVGIDAMLEVDGVDSISATGHTIHTYSRYL